MKTSFTLRLLSTVFIVSFFLGSCSHKPDGNLVTAGSPMAESIRFGYAVYMLPVHTKDPAVILHDVLAKKYPSLKLVSESPKQPDQMVVRIRNTVHPGYRSISGRECGADLEDCVHRKVEAAVSGWPRKLH